jgi:hypothetical protein
MLTTKISTIIVSTVAVGAVSLPAAASAAALLPRPGTLTQVRTVQTSTAVPLKEAGSAGVPGYTDKKCESLLNSYEQNRGAAENYANYGDVATSLATAEYAGTIKQELENNCLTVD